MRTRIAIFKKKFLKKVSSCEKVFLRGKNEKKINKSILCICHSPLPDWNADADELLTAEVMAVQQNFQKGTLDVKLLRK